MARRRRRKVFFTGDPNGLQPGDDVGNRIKKQAQRLPPDDIGNRKSDDPEHIVPPDDLGNRIDANPTHEMSGIVWGNVDPKSKGAQRRRRLKSGGPAQRIGRYFAGGVNPMVSGDASRAQEAQEGDHKRRREQRQQERASNRGTNDHSDGGSGGSPDESGGGGKRKKRFDQVDGHQALEVNRRRAQRFFEFEEDDRFKYTLKTPAADKRRDSEQCVQRILDEAGRDATAKATLLPDGDRPKVLVTIEDRGPSPDVPKDKQSKDAADPLFPMGSGTLMSLNYLVNKIVNRYPDDRIRLAILPIDEEKNYLEALEAHIAKRKEPAAKDSGANGKPSAKKVDDGADKPKARAKAKKAESAEAPANEPDAASLVDQADEQAPDEEAPDEAAPTTKKVKVTKKASATAAGAKKTTKKVTKKATTKKVVATKKVTKKAPTKKVTKKAATTKKAAAKKTTKKVTKKVTKKAPATKATKKATKKAK